MRRIIGACLLAAAIISVPPSAFAQSPTRRVILDDARPLRALKWISLAIDPQHDGLRPSLPDARELSYALDSAHGRVWFCVTLHDAVPQRWFGMSVAIDNDADPNNGMVWWGTNKIKFDRVGGAYLTNAVEQWQGYSGVADATGLGAGSMNNLTSDVKVAVDRDRQSILLGLPTAVFGDAPTVRVIATVGSMVANNDDVPNENSVVVRLIGQ